MAHETSSPAGYHTITPYVRVQEPEGFVAYAQRVFGAEQIERHDGPDGRIMHAEVRIGDSVVMVGRAQEPTGRAMPGCLYVYVGDADAIYRGACEAGGESIMEPTDMFWGDRFASVRDPFGNEWCVATRVEDVSPEEVARRAKQFNEQCGG